MHLNTLHTHLHTFIDLGVNRQPPCLHMDDVENIKMKTPSKTPTGFSCLNAADLVFTFKFERVRTLKADKWSPPPSLTQCVNGGTDLEGGAQLDVHGGDEVVLSQQQESLAINFLRQELGGQLFAA